MRIRAQAILPALSEKREDDIMNVWHFQTVLNDDLLSFGNIVYQLGQFYNYIGTYIPNHRQNVVLVKLFDIDSPPPRQPVYQDIQPLAPGGAGYLPTELACVLSYRAAPVSGQPQRRRRGRLYIGPFRTVANDAATGRVSEDVRTAIADAAVNLSNGIKQVPGPCTWEIYSPTTGLMHEVEHVHVDDAWDIQRRRGVDAVNRTIRELP